MGNGMEGAKKGHMASTLNTTWDNSFCTHLKRYVSKSDTFPFCQLYHVACVTTCMPKKACVLCSKSTFAWKLLKWSFQCKVRDYFFFLWGWIIVISCLLSEGKLRGWLKNSLLLGNFDPPPGVTVVQGDWSQLTPSWEDQWVQFSMVTPPNSLLCISVFHCVSVSCICVKKREWEGKRGREREWVCVCVCIHSCHFESWEYVALSSHRRSKLLNVKVVLVQVPAWTWLLVLNVKCVLHNLHVVLWQQGEPVTPHKSESVSHTTAHM